MGCAGEPRRRALLERGDLRGELIALQCLPARSREQQRRERELLAAHGMSWLGELAPIVKRGYRFERGFLAECRIDSNKGTRIRPLVGHPAWSTVHTLLDSAQIALHPIMRSLRTLEFRPNRARNREQLNDSWRELLAGRPRPIERLRFTDLDMYAARDEQIALLRRCEAMPQLRELHVGGLASMYMDALFASPVAARLETIGFEFEDYAELPLVRLRDHLREATIARVVVVHGDTALRIERGGNQRATAVLSSPATANACALIGALPTTIRELRIRTPSALGRAGLLALTLAARALPSLEVREIGPEAVEP